MSWRDDRGQAGVELIAVFPALLATAGLIIYLIGVAHSSLDARTVDRLEERRLEIGLER